MQDFAASFPSLKKSDDLTPPTAVAGALLRALSGEERARRVWQQPLGDVHVKLGTVVGSAPLLLRFDTSDSEFVFGLSARWPIHADQTASLVEADAIKLADALNGLVRLYAIETGNTRLHVLVEARRGKFEVPSWWANAPVLFATYAFDTGFAQVGLFADLNDAYGDMDLLTQPHRLLVAIGPATPEHLRREKDTADGAWIDPDAERLKALKRWNQQLSMQLNRLLADIFSGGEAEMEAIVDGLSRMRDTSTRLSAQILKMEKRVHKPKVAAPDTPAAPKAAAPVRQEPTLDEFVAHLRAGLKRGAGAATQAGRVMKENLDTLVKIESAKPAASKLEPELPKTKQTAKKKPMAPGITLALMLLLLAAPAAARTCATGLHSGLEPYPDIMKGCGYLAKDTTSTRDCRGDVAKAARRKFGSGARVDFTSANRVTIDGAAYSYACRSKGAALTSLD